MWTISPNLKHDWVFRLIVMFLKGCEQEGRALLFLTFPIWESNCCNSCWGCRSATRQSARNVGSCINGGIIRNIIGVLTATIQCRLSFVSLERQPQVSWKNCCMFEWGEKKKVLTSCKGTQNWRTAVCVVMETIHSLATFSSALINSSDPLKRRKLACKWRTEKSGDEEERQQGQGGQIRIHPLTLNMSGFIWFM